MKAVGKLYKNHTHIGLFLKKKRRTKDKSKKENMLTEIHPKLPMRNKKVTREFYLNKLGFKEIGTVDYDAYLMLEKDQIQIHFFEFKALDPQENYGQVYIRTNNIEEFYQTLLDKKTHIHPNGPLQIKPWGQKEFSILDPDSNLLTFGQSITK
jgi:catechol 2,3-dioxygenase-like lactoylglutathione lyase family enzyme